MSDLVIRIPNHGYSDDDAIFVSWLDDIFYVADKNDFAFKIVTASSGSTYVQFTKVLTDGFVRQIDDTAGVGVIDGLDHLEGELVKVTSGGVVTDTQTVQNGEISVSSIIFTYQVGLPYTMKVRTMRLSIPQDGTTVQSRIKRINRTTVRFLRSQNGTAGQEYAGVEYLQPVLATYSAESSDTTPDNRLAQGGFSEDAYTTIVSEDPSPYTVLATIVDVEVEK